MSSFFSRWWKRLQPRLRRRAQDEQDLDDEVRFHLAQEAQLRIERGVPPEEARTSARRDFGNIPLVTEATRDMWGWTWLERIAQDVRFAGRMLARSPAFTVVALCTLALGIGATTAIFTVVNSVLLRALSFPEPDRLVMVWEQSPSGNTTNVVQTQNFLDWRTRNRAFEAIAAFRQLPANVMFGGEAEQVLSLTVTAEFFSVLDVPPMLGRPILSGEGRPGGQGTVVLSHTFWQRWFGGNPTIIGRSISVNGRPLEIVGVMPAGFSFPGVRAELFSPLVIDPVTAPQDGRNFSTVARLRRGVGVQAAQADMDGIAAQTARERPQMNARWGANVVPLRDEAVGQIRPALLVLFGAVGCVLLIACANVANLLLMRATARARELTIRLALGAGRWRLAHQLVVESVLLAGLGGALGLLLALFGVPILVSLFPETFPLPRADEIRVDGWVLGFTTCVSMGAGILFGVLPGFLARRNDPMRVLHGSGRAVVGSGAKVRALLVTGEVALALMLVVGTGLMVRSLTHLYAVDPGFRPEHVLTLRMLLLPSKYLDVSRRAAFVEQVLERVREIPGVTAAGSVHFLPLSGSESGTGVYRADRPAPAPGAGSSASVSVITPGYFPALGIPVIAGRDIDQRDRMDALRVAIVNQAFAREFFPNDEPLGKRLKVWWSSTRGDDIPEFEIVGLAGNVRHEGMHKGANPTVFLVHGQEPNLFASLVVRTAGEPLTVAAAVRKAIRSIDPEQGVSDVQTMESVLADSVARPRLQAILFGLFGALALVMACVGLYGLISYSVQQRVREMGVRLALGAAPSSILRLVVGEGLRLTVVGLVVGLVAALMLTRYLATLLYGVTPTDPGVFVAVGALLLTVAITACYLPARRATRIDPARVLRDE
ncbi:MAG: FtsX-like permease family protein [Luteitalea sp.]|nr:FtsX-like permease family protein [Luteitalea sp.]